MSPHQVQLTGLLALPLLLGVLMMAPVARGQSFVSEMDSLEPKSSRE